MLYMLLAIALCLLAPLPAILMFRYGSPRPAVDVSKALPVNELPRPGSPPAVDAAFMTAEQLPAAFSGSEGGGNASILIQGTPDDSASDSTQAYAGTAGSGKNALPVLTLRSSHYVELVVALPLTFGSSILLATLLHFIAEAHARTFPPAVFLFRPQAYGFIFLGPAFLIGLLTIVPLTHGLVYLLRGRALYREYVMWEEGWMSERRTTLKAVFRLYAYLAAIATLLFAVFVVLEMNWYVRFTEDSIYEKPFFGFSERAHSYDSVDQIVYSTYVRKDKAYVYEPHLGLRFNDGTRWRTNIIQLPDDADERDRILAFLIGKTGKYVVTTRLMEDIPGWATAHPDNGPIAAGAGQKDEDRRSNDC